MATDAMEQRWNPVHNDDGDFIVTETGEYLDELPIEDVLLRVARDHNRALYRDDLKRLMNELVQGIDRWNERVKEIIGHEVERTWPALEESRDLLERIEATEHDQELR